MDSFQNHRHIEDRISFVRKTRQPAGPAEGCHPLPALRAVANEFSRSVRPRAQPRHAEAGIQLDTIGRGVAPKENAHQVVRGHPHRTGLEAQERVERLKRQRIELLPQRQHIGHLGPTGDPGIAQSECNVGKYLIHDRQGTTAAGDARASRCGRARNVACSTHRCR